jgi:hypothetical protein
MEDLKSIRVTKLILVPAVITLLVTFLRLAGELKHWPAPWFNTAAGGGGAIVGIAWLPIIFGPYFAMKLAGAGNVPGGPGKVMGLSLAGLAVFVAGGALFARTIQHPSILALVALVVMVASLFLPRHAWPTLGNVLLAYAFVARVPVMVVMYYAMRGNDGAGWGTHYDRVAPPLANLPFMTKFIEAAILPQMTVWIAWTVILGMIFGTIALLLARRGKQPATVSV